ncbi:IS110 family transposase [uncultured Williamsia sp.]|uniref:IS110 family transposase n=1 Tax=uncultured Williamsia sp. TaxID=259311 RepID=UPI0026106494|nr:IS110 family transposase [uncultured Williamsia sp.]
MASMTKPASESSLDAVYVGIDTHKYVHHAALIDPLGRHLTDRPFDATTAGYQALIDWIADHQVTAIGVEGTGSYGTGLTHALTAAGHTVIDVDRPDRKARRANGKSDPVDAYAAATAVAAGRASTTPKTRDGAVEAIRLVHNARRQAVTMRATAITELKAVILTTPPQLREQLAPLTRAALITRCLRLRPDSTGDRVLYAAKLALRSTARRITTLTTEIDELQRELEDLLHPVAEGLLALPGVGTDSAAQLLVAFGDNPERITTAAQFAHLCGAAPIHASSGTRVRHRLNRGGNRQANRALHTIVTTRLRTDQRTRAYLAKRTAEGKTRREITRCLKRYVAREIHHHITAPHAPLAT